MFGFSGFAEVPFGSASTQSNILLLTGLNCIAEKLSSSGAIIQLEILIGLDCIAEKLSSIGSIIQTFYLTGSNADIVHLSSTGSFAILIRDWTIVPTNQGTWTDETKSNSIWTGQ
jgi:hypothetical protein